MDNLLKIAKPFTENLRKNVNNITKPVLRTASITENYITATNSHILIRLKHNEVITEPYLHYYVESDKKNPKITNYPDVQKVIPDTYNADISFSLGISDINEWKKAFSAAKATKHAVNRIDLDLKNNVLHVPMDQSKPHFEQVSFKHSLDNPINVDYKASFNYNYLEKVMNVFKKLKSDHVNVYTFGRLKPVLFKTDEAEVIVLPIRTY